MPANKLERDLATAVRDYLTFDIERGLIGTGDVPAIRRRKTIIDGLGQTTLSLIANARFDTGEVRLDLDASRIAAVVEWVDAPVPESLLAFTIPFRRRRRGVETRLIIGSAPPVRDDSLIANIARAEQWRAALCNGEPFSTIAVRDGVTVKYLGQMLHFAFLSPKLVRAILLGCQPPALTTNWIRRHGLPACWAEQDRILAQL